MQTLTKTVGPLAAASANAICLSQTRSSAGALTLNGALVTGGVATMDTPRNLTIPSNGSDNSAVKFTFIGTTFAGAANTETVAGPSASADAFTLTDFLTVTSIKTSTGLTGSLTVGTASTAGSEWAFMDHYASGSIYIQCVVTGTVNYTVQSTLDNPNSVDAPISQSSVNWSSDLTSVVGATANASVGMNVIPNIIRILLNSGTGSVKMKVLQSSTAVY